MARTATDSAEALSTAPREDDDSVGAGGPGLPGLGPIGWLRWFWRQLTSMRVALILLFLLSLAAIPGSLIPQEATSPTSVDDFKAAHRWLGPLYDKLGMYHVYSSVWFSAVYLLLFVSLAGCIVPRAWQFVGQLRSRPPRAPGRLDRMPAHAAWTTDADAEEVLAAARRLLRRRRFRVVRDTDSVASEKGYLREAGNLVFHIALFGLLIAFAAGQLDKSYGTKVVVEGTGFANTLTQYDDFKHGALFDTDSMAHFGFVMSRFDATYARSGPDKGSPRTFAANLTYYGADGRDHRTTVKVNKPLQIDGYNVYLGTHGYAPVVTVHDGKGNVAYSGPVPFLPVDSGNLTSQGVVKVPDAIGPDGKRDQLAFQGFFVPTFGGPAAGTMFSQFPALDNPVLLLTAYHGDLGMDSGLPQNVYQLDTSSKLIKQFKNADGSSLAQKLVVGQSMQLPGGNGSITFDGIKSWASFEVVHQPGTDVALISAILMISGLAGSLFIQRRRVWVRATADGSGRTRVELAGLGRSESPRAAQDLAAVVEALHAEAPTSAAGNAEEPAPDTPAENTAEGPSPDGPEQPTEAPKDRSDKERA